MSINIEALRQELQKPRRHKDSLYGRLVMRRLSVYITALLAQFSVSPFAVNLVSILSGLVGAWLMMSGYLVWGIALVNFWYLLDHVDGELARYQKIFYATGLYLDSMANLIVIPAAFIGLGAALDTVGRAWLFTGLAAGYGSMMLFAVPYCEAAVILQRFRQGRLQLMRPSESGVIATENSQPLSKKIFSWGHELATFPVFLPLATIAVFMDDQVLKMLLVVYAFLTNFIWVSVVTDRVIHLKIDKQYPLIS